MAGESKKETVRTGDIDKEINAALNKEACIFMALAGALAVISVPAFPFKDLALFFQKAPVVEMCFAGIALGIACGAYVLFMLAYIKLHRAYRQSETKKKQHLVNVGITLCGTAVIAVVVSAIALLMMVK